MSWTADCSGDLELHEENNSEQNLRTVNNLWFPKEIAKNEDKIS